jgi:myo-inositol-1(or 4)-monophosphatase
VSIALGYQGDIILGVIYNPVLDEMFTAEKGRGARLNDKSIHVSAITGLGKSLLAIGFPYDRNAESFSRSLRYFSLLARDSQAIRREGSTSLSLCNVARGRFDGFCVAGNEVWDYAAGILLVREAGGRVTDFQGAPFQIGGSGNEVLATNGSIHDAILKCLREAGAT